MISAVIFDATDIVVGIAARNVFACLAQDVCRGVARDVRLDFEGGAVAEQITSLSGIARGSLNRKPAHRACSHVRRDGGSRACGISAIQRFALSRRSRRVFIVTKRNIRLHIDLADPAVIARTDQRGHGRVGLAFDELHGYAGGIQLVAAKIVRIDAAKQNTLLVFIIERIAIEQHVGEMELSLALSRYTTRIGLLECVGGNFDIRSRHIDAIQVSSRQTSSILTVKHKVFDRYIVIGHALSAPKVA